MNKKTLNIISVCVVSLIIVFSITQKKNTNDVKSNNIEVKDEEKVLTKAEQYQSDILETISQENIKTFQEIAKTFEKNNKDNLTDGLSKDIFAQYIKYNTSGDIEKDDILKVADEVLKKDTGVSEPVSYQDIKTVASTMSNLKTYGNNLVIIQNGLTSGINSLGNKTNKTPYIASMYSKVADLILFINAPESLADNHIQLINGFKKYSEGMFMLNDQFSDPAKALLGLKKTKEATDEIFSSLDKIKKTIDLNKVTYSPTEPGYLLNK